MCCTHVYYVHDQVVILAVLSFDRLMILSDLFGNRLVILP